MKKKKMNKKTKFALKSLLLLFGVLIAAGLAFVVFLISQAPDISEIDATPQGYMTTILDKDENVINHLSVTESNRIYVKLDEIPVDLQKAFIAIEDARFYDHSGIDIIGIIRAGVKGVLSGFDFSQGASTITQQLLKNNVFTDWMSESTFYDRLSRKIQEQYLAVRLEQQYSKEWILENYLNTINLGGGTRGVQVAAEYYFGKDVSDLTLAECALIAGITKNPSAYDPLKNPEKSIERQHLVLNAMLEQEMISQEQYDAAILENVVTKLNEESKNQSAKIFSWFEDAMLVQIVEDLTTKYTYTEEEAWDLLYSGGLTIYSTQDTQLQEICENVVTTSEAYTGEEQISVVMTDVTTGAVSALIGGREVKDSSLVYNRATSSVRQPGSTIKVIGEYAAALEEGEITLGTVLDDAPYSYSDGTSMSNSYSSYKGMTTVREGIAVSGNVLALKVFQRVGADAVYEYLQKFGITTLTEEDKNEALSLGGTYNGVTNLELTAAYNTIANDGNYIKPYYYTKVVDRNNKVILENTPEPQQAITKDTAQLLTSAMEDVITSGTGTACAVNGVTLAGKSGTTNDNKDLWFVGFSSYYTCGIWGGYDDNANQTSGGYVKQIWQDIMEAAHEGKENQSLVNTKEFSAATICTKCGNLAKEGLCDNTLQGNMTQREYFRKGEKPSRECDCHVEVTICKDSNMLVGSYCPSDSKVKNVYLLSGTSGTEDAQYVIPENLKKSLEENTSGTESNTPENGNAGSDDTGNDNADVNGDGTGNGADGTGNNSTGNSGTGDTNSDGKGTCNVHTHFWDQWFPSGGQDGANQNGGNGQAGNNQAGAGTQNNGNGSQNSGNDQNGDGNQNSGNNQNGGSQNSGNGQNGDGSQNSGNGQNGDGTPNGENTQNGNSNHNGDSGVLDGNHPDGHGVDAGEWIEDIFQGLF